jgi:hypothetical protein
MRRAVGFCSPKKAPGICSLMVSLTKTLECPAFGIIAAAPKRRTRAGAVIAPPNSLPASVAAPFAARSRKLSEWRISAPQRVFLMLICSFLPFSAKAFPRHSRSVGIKEVIETINRMQADGVIERYAIGGAVGATFYLEPVATLDIDVFIEFHTEPG